MIQVMLDVETLSTRPNAALLSIGAVKFDRDEIVGGFHVGVDTADAVERYGCHIDADTVMWWFAEERAEARKALLELPKVDLYSAMHGFADWVRTTPGEDLGSMWGKGATFDNVIFATLARATGVESPFGYRADECYRTFANRFPDIPFVPPEAGAHDALADATAQAKHLQAICRAHDIKL